jgi:hypothetical protein
LLEAAVKHGVCGQAVTAYVIEKAMKELAFMPSYNYN